MKDDLQADITKTVEILSKGGVIIYPTDTIWGLGCDATNEKAVSRVYKMKMRHHSKSMIILIDTIDKLSKYLKHVPEIAISLIDQITTPLTIIYPHAQHLAKNVISKDGTVAIRIVNDSFCKQLCSAFEKPIVSTSANISGFGNPILFREIDTKLIEQADYVVEYGRNSVNQIKPSTIIKLKNDWEYEIIRA
jgi:L-threonylcarbamoyladenylate synthase